MQPENASSSFSVSFGVTSLIPGPFVLPDFIVPSRRKERGGGCIFANIENAQKSEGEQTTYIEYLEKTQYEKKLLRRREVLKCIIFVPYRSDSYLSYSFLLLLQKRCIREGCCNFFGFIIFSPSVANVRTRPVGPCVAFSRACEI